MPGEKICSVKKLILLIIISILIPSGLTLAKEAPFSSTKTQTIYAPAFWSVWNPKEQMFDFGRVNKNIKLGPEMSIKTSSAYSDLCQEFIDIHKAALKMQNKYLSKKHLINNKKYTLSSYSRFAYFTLKGWGEELMLYECLTRRLLFTYQDEEEEDSEIYFILEQESWSSWIRREKISKRKKELDDIISHSKKKRIKESKKELNIISHPKKKKVRKKVTVHKLRPAHPGSIGIRGVHRFRPARRGLIGIGGVQRLGLSTQKVLKPRRALKSRSRR